MRSKTFRRLFLLLMAVVATAVVLLFLYGQQRAAFAAKLADNRAQGLAAFAAADYPAAVSRLGWYLSKPQGRGDADAIVAYARSASLVPTERGGNLKDAITWYRNALQLRPGDANIQAALLGLYPRVGYYPEAKALADDVLAVRPHDALALRTRGRAFDAMRDFPAALADARQLVAADPADVDGQKLVLRVMFEQKASQADLEKYGQAIAAAHPNEPRCWYIAGIAATSDLNAAAANFRKAAALPPTDAPFAIELATGMQRVGLFEDARRYMTACYAPPASAHSSTAPALATAGDPRLLKMLVTSQWEDGQLPWVLDHTADLKPTDPAADTDLLAYRALSLAQQSAGAIAATQSTTASAEVATIVAALAGRTGDASAVTWAASLDARFIHPRAALRDRIAAYQSAIQSGQENGVVRLLLGQAFNEEGELDLALAAWRSASDDLPGWAMPRFEAAQALVAAGRFAAGASEAAAAAARSPNAVQPAVTLCLAWAGELAQSPDADLASRTLALAQRLQAHAKPGVEPETLPIEVALLAQVNRKADAETAAQAGLAATPPLPADAALRLASACEAAQLSPATVAQAQALSRRTSGDSSAAAYEHALAEANAGHADAALQSLRQAARAHGDSADWQLAVAQFRQAMNQPDAAASWRALGDAFPDNLQVQTAVLAAPTRAADRPSWKNAIDRLHALTGDAGTLWRLEQARYVVVGPAAGDSRELGDAMSSLQDLITRDPSSIAPRLLLEAALEKVPNPTEAIKQLQLAATVEPDNVDVNQRLYDLLIAQGRTADANVVLQTLAKNASHLPPAARARVASALASANQPDRGIALLEARPADANTGTPADPAGDLVLTDLYARTGHFEKAAGVYANYLHADRPSVDVLQQAATAFAAHGDVSAGRQYLARLDEPALAATLRPGLRDLVNADFEGRFGDAATAETLYAKATAESPTDPTAWQQRAAFELRQNRPADARETITAGLQQVPNDPALLALQLQAASAGPADVQPLIAALAKDPNNAGAVETLRVLAAQPNGRIATADAAQQLRAVADKYPAYMPAQQLLVQVYLSLAMPEQAGAVATRAVATAPADPVAARLPVQVAQAMRQWDALFDAAQHWRQLTIDHPADADVAIATAQIGRGDAARGLKTIQPYLASAQQHPDDATNAAVLEAAARGEIVTGQGDAAAVMLRPLATSNDLAAAARWQRMWFSLALSQPNDAAAGAWLNTIAPAATDPAARSQLARTWFALYRKYGTPGDLANAQAVLDPLTAASTASPDDWRLLAQVRELQGDWAGCESADRKVLALQPGDAGAANDVAYLILLRGGDLAEAHQLAAAACAAAPTTPGYHDTLARIDARQGDRAASAAAFDAELANDPTSIAAMVGKADVLLQSGQRDQAQASLKRADTLTASGIALAPEVQAEMGAVRAALAGGKGAAPSGG